MDLAITQLHPLFVAEVRGVDLHRTTIIDARGDLAVGLH